MANTQNIAVVSILARGGVVGRGTLRTNDNNQIHHVVISERDNDNGETAVMYVAAKTLEQFTGINFDGVIELYVPDYCFPRYRQVKKFLRGEETQLHQEWMKNPGKDGRVLAWDKTIDELVEATKNAKFIVDFKPRHQLHVLQLVDEDGKAIQLETGTKVRFSRKDAILGEKTKRAVCSVGYTASGEKVFCREYGFLSGEFAVKADKYLGAVVERPVNGRVKMAQAADKRMLESMPSTDLTSTIDFDNLVDVEDSIEVEEEADEEDSIEVAGMPF